MKPEFGLRNQPVSGSASRRRREYVHVGLSTLHAAHTSPELSNTVLTLCIYDSFIPNRGKNENSLELTAKELLPVRIRGYRDLIIHVRDFPGTMRARFLKPKLPGGRKKVRRRLHAPG